MSEQLDRYVEEVLASELVIETDPELVATVRAQYDD